MLANRLKILLAERDLTIKDVVNAIGLSRPSVSNMVNNPFANIATENLDKLCNYLEVTPKDFFDYSSWLFSFNFAKGGEKQPSISITMKSGKMVRTIHLLLNFDYIDPANSNNNAEDEHEIIIASDPNGYDESFVAVYGELSPLFKHQIESELIKYAKKALQIYDDKNTVPCVFNYDHKGEVIFEATLN